MEIKGFQMEKGKETIQIEGSRPISDLGVSYGFGVFETFLVQTNGNVFLLDKHMDRLFASLTFFEIPLKITKEELEQGILSLVNNNALQGQVVRVNVTFGNREKGIPPAILISHCQLKTNPEIYSRGYRLIISEIRRNESSFMPVHKTMNYMENFLLGQKATKEGFDDIVFLNGRGFISETTKANLFFVGEGKIYTPSRDSGVLPGVTRGWVIEAVKELGMTCIEGHLSMNLFLESDEIFLTNAVVGIVPVCSIDHTSIQNKTGNNTTRVLMDQYRKNSQ